MRNRILKISNIKKTVNYLKKNGVRHAYFAARERIEEERKADYYYKAPTEGELTEQRKETEAFSYLFSIVVPAYETRAEFIREMIESVRRQSYRKWELVLVDASASDVVKHTVEEIMRKIGDARIKYRRLAKNKGIAGNTNAGIALAAGDYIALLDHDDFLSPDALYYMAVAVHEAGQRGVRPVLLYTDEDKVESRSGNHGKRVEYTGNGEYNECYFSPHRKQKFNLDLILSNNYICHFMAIEGGLLKTLQLRGKYDGAQDYDLVLQVVDKLLADKEGSEWERRIIHIPRVLYHWRCHVDSTAENTASKTYAYEAGKMALEDFCKKQGWRVRVEHSLHLGFYDVVYEPDILSVRSDIGIEGGRILNRLGRVCAGMYDERGAVLFEGLPKEYSGGSTHRAILLQDCVAVDIRCMRIRPELYPLFKEVTGVSYQEKTVRNDNNGSKMRIADISSINCDEAGYRKLSMELCRAVRDRGCRVLWNPKLTWKNVSVSVLPNGGKI